MGRSSGPRDRARTLDDGITDGRRIVSNAKHAINAFLSRSPAERSTPIRFSPPFATATLNAMRAHDPDEATQKLLLWIEDAENTIDEGPTGFMNVPTELDAQFADADPRVQERAQNLLAHIQTLRDRMEDIEDRHADQMQHYDDAFGDGVYRGRPREKAMQMAEAGGGAKMGPSARTLETWALVKPHWERGLNAGQIARETGLSRTDVISTVHKVGASGRGPKPPIPPTPPNPPSNVTPFRKRGGAAAVGGAAGAAAAVGAEDEADALPRPRGANRVTRLVRPEAGRLTPDQGYIVQRLREGADLRTIRDELETSNASFNVQLSRLRRAREAGDIDVDIPNLPRSGRTGPVENFRERVVALYQQGLTPTQIAERLGATPESVAVTASKARRAGLLSAAGAGGLAGSAALTTNDAEAADITAQRPSTNINRAEPASRFVRTMAAINDIDTRPEVINAMRMTGAVTPNPGIGMGLNAMADVIDDPVDVAREFTTAPWERLSADTIRGGFPLASVEPGYYASGAEIPRAYPDYRAPGVEEGSYLYHDPASYDARGRKPLNVMTDVGYAAASAMRLPGRAARGGSVNAMRTGSREAQTAVARERAMRADYAARDAHRAERFGDRVEDQVATQRAERVRDAIPHPRGSVYINTASPPPAERFVGADGGRRYRLAPRSDQKLKQPNPDRLRQDQVLRRANLEAAINPIKGRPPATSGSMNAAVEKTVQGARDAMVRHAGQGGTRRQHARIADAARHTVAEEGALSGSARRVASTALERAGATAQRGRPQPTGTVERAVTAPNMRGRRSLVASTAGHAGLVGGAAVYAASQARKVPAEETPKIPTWGEDRVRDRRGPPGPPVPQPPLTDQVGAAPPAGRQIPVTLPQQPPSGSRAQQPSGQGTPVINTELVTGPYAPGRSERDRGARVAPNEELFERLPEGFPRNADDVRLLQRILNEKRERTGYRQIGIDGVIGGDTQGAMDALESAYGRRPQDAEEAFRMALALYDGDADITDLQLVIARAAQMNGQPNPLRWSGSDTGIDGDYGSRSKKVVAALLGLDPNDPRSLQDPRVVAIGRDQRARNDFFYRVMLGNDQWEEQARTTAARSARR